MARQCQIHILSLTTGQPHNLTSNPIIQHDALDVDQVWIYKVRNSGSFFGVLTSLDLGRLLIFYNWRTGERVLVPYYVVLISQKLC